MKRVEIHATARVCDTVHIMGDLQLAAGVDVGANVTFFPGVSVGMNTRILPGAVIGRPPIRAGATNRPVDGGGGSVRIGADCVIGANAVLYTDLEMGGNVLIGDLATLREGCRIADAAVIGRGTTLMHDVHVGERSRIHNQVFIVGDMVIEADVFIAGCVSTINDGEVYLKRFGLIPFSLAPPIVRRFALVGTGATLGAGVEIGMGALVAPAAMVTKDVAPWTVVAGVPARRMRDIDADERTQILRHFDMDADNA